MAKLSFPNLDFINIFVQVRILKMCATSSSSAGLTCQLSRSPDLDQERRAHCLLSCLLGRFFTLDLNWQRRTWQLPFAWLPRALAGLFWDCSYYLDHWDGNSDSCLLGGTLKEYLSYTVGHFFVIASVPIVVVRNQKWVKSKAVIMGRFFIDHVYPLDGRLIEKFLSSSFLDDNHASVDW